MKKDFCFIGFVVDRSGSMSSVVEATISAFNHFVEDQKTVPGEAHLYAVQFDDVYDKLYDGDLKGAPELTGKTYIPRNTTALHDAMGRTIEDIGSRLEKMSEDQRPEKVVIVTLTDGLENASRKYTRQQLADLIKQQQEKYNWQFVFLGANQDAIMTGESFNIPAMNSITYASMSKKAVGNVVNATSTNLRRYRSGQSVTMNYASSQREEAMEEDKTSGKQPPTARSQNTGSD